MWLLGNFSTTSREALTVRCMLDVLCLFYMPFAGSINDRGLFPQDLVVAVLSVICDGRFFKFFLPSGILIIFDPGFQPPLHLYNITVSRNSMHK